MKKSFLFGLLAILLAGFGFGGVSLAYECSTVDGETPGGEFEVLAYIGGGESVACYTTLPAAVGAANDGDIIVMENDYSFPDNSKIIISKNLTLDLNGHLIEKTYIDTQYLLDVNAGKTLTVKDSAGEGKISRKNGMTAIRVLGTLIVDGGTIESINNPNYSITIKCDEDGVSNGGTVIINSGTIIGGSGQAIQAWGNVTLNGGLIQGDVISRSHKGSAQWNPGNIVIKDGTIIGSVIAIQWIPTAEIAKVTIEGGEINGNVNAQYNISGVPETNTLPTDDIPEGTPAPLFIIKGGVFTDKPDINYISDGYSVYKNSESKYVVTTTVAAEQGAAEAIVTPDPVVAAETTFTTGATEDFSATVPAADLTNPNVVQQKLPDVAGDTAVYTLTVDTKESIEKVDESGDTSLTMTGVKESELLATSGNTLAIKGGAEVYIVRADGTSTGKNLASITFDKPIAIPIFIGTDMAGKNVLVKVKHATGEAFGFTGLSSNGTTYTPVTSALEVTVGANGYAIAYTCQASTFVAYTETAPTSTTTSSSSHGGSSSSYSCKNLPANAVANNTTKPKKNTDYSYSTDTGAVCTFQCKTGYTWNETDSKCEKADETVADTETNKDETTATEDTENSDTSATEDLQKVLEDGYNVEFHNAYEFAFKNGITTMPTIQEADMNGNLNRIAMAKMLSQYAINILGKTPDTTREVPNFPDVDAQLDADYNNGVTLAYQLGIMGINIDEFRPFDLVTRAEFGTALSRMLFGLADGEGDAYYSTHLEKLMSEGIITNDNPRLDELRGYVMIMLMRSANK